MTFRTQEDIMQYWTSKSDAPMVSIRCITYNHESFIAQALDSFLMQKTVFPFEIVVHDDASSDKTANIVREYEKKYPDIIKPIYEEENQYSKNVAQFRKIVDDACRGKYIAYCEGDDYWIDPNKLQMQVDWLESHPDYTMCCSDAVIESPNGILDWHRYENDCDIPVKKMIMEGGGFIQSPTIVYRKDLLKNYPDACRTCYVGDYPLQIWSVINGNVRYFARKTATYRFLHAGSWNSRRITKPLEDLQRYYLSEFTMFDELNTITKGKYNFFFINREARLLYNLSRERKKDKKNILKAFENYERNFPWQQKIEGLLIRLGLWSLIDPYLLATQKRYKDALYSLPVMKIIVPFIYYNVLGHKRLPKV